MYDHFTARGSVKLPTGLNIRRIVTYMSELMKNRHKQKTIDNLIQKEQETQLVIEEQRKIQIQTKQGYKEKVHL